MLWVTILDLICHFLLMDWIENKVEKVANLVSSDQQCSEATLPFLIPDYATVHRASFLSFENHT